MIDIVVGAHSHTFLYTGTPPDPNDVPFGPYPTVIEQQSGKKVPVVQAYAWSKYLGKLLLSVSIIIILIQMFGFFFMLLK